MAKRKAKPLRDRITQQARQQAQLKYAPQRRELSGQQQQIADQFASQAKIEQASARGIAESIDQVKPKVAGYTAQAQGIADQGSRDLAQYLSGNVLQGAAARDAVGVKSRLAEMLANANTELDRRKVDAQAGAKYTIGSLRASAGKALEDVGGRLSDLASDEGTYAATTENTLRNQAANRAVTRRGQNLSHQDRVASRRAADRRARQGGGGGPGGGKRATPAVQNRAQDKIAAAIGFAQKLKKDPKTGQDRPRSVVGSTLLAGNREAQLPSFQQDPIYLTAALDMVYDGHLSRETVRKLHSRQIVVNDLGYTTAGQQKRRRDRISRSQIGTIRR